MDKKVELQVLNITNSQAQVGAFAMLLGEVDGERQLPIIIGPAEAQATALYLKGIKTPRPLTHDLFTTSLTVLGVSLIRVLIYKAKDGIFYSYVYLKRDEDIIRIDARTSDAIALAVRADCPILIYESILDRECLRIPDEERNLWKKNMNRRRAVPLPKHLNKHWSRLLKTRTMNWPLKYATRSIKEIKINNYYMHVFYTPDIQKTNELPEEEAQHCTRVLRLSIGDEITLTDGKGSFYKAEITAATNKRCLVAIKETIFQKPLWPCHLHIAMAPTKNMDRNEWFAEKATEIGFDELTFLNCRFSERKVIKNERIEKILISAIKQSLKARLPKLNEMTDFNKFINQEFKGQKFIAHCYEGEKPLLKDVLKAGEDALVLIGPEGDFSEGEVEKAIERGFTPISLGKSRLRTETAALVACHTLNLLNQQ